MFHESNDRRREGIVLGYMGNCYRRLGELPRALEFVQRGMDIKTELGDQLEIGKSHNQFGLIYWDMAEYGKAIAHLERAAAFGHEYKDPELEGQAHNNLGLVYDETGDYRHSEEEYKEALRIHRAAHNERGEGDALSNIGGVHLLLGEYREALGYYQQALAIHERLNLRPTASIDLGNIGICSTAVGNLDTALTTFDKALDLAKEAGLEKEQADWHKGKGEALLHLGKFALAMEEYRQAQKIYERAGLKRELVEALNDTGNSYLMLGDIVSSEKDFRRGLELAQAIGNNRGVIINLISLGDVEWRRKRLPEAEGFHQDALARARKAGDHDTITATLVQLALEHREMSKLAIAETEAREALQEAQASSIPPAEARSHYALAEVQRSNRHFDDALQEYFAAGEINKVIGDPDLGWRTDYGRGQSLEKLGRDQQALAAYKHAVSVIEDVRSQLAEERFRAGYIEDKCQVYVALVELLLKLREPDEAFLYSEKLRAHSFLQMNRGIPSLPDTVQREAEAELRERIRQLRRSMDTEWSQPKSQRRSQALDTFSQDLASAERAYENLLDDLRRSNTNYSMLHALTVPSAAQIQRLLPPKAALVEYVVADTRLVIFVLTSEQIRVTTVPISAKNLRTRVDLLRDLIARYETDYWRSPAAGLRRVLITELEEHGWLKGVNKLYLVPNGVLNYVPFAALPRSATGDTRFLVDDYILSYLPSAALLAVQHKSNAPAGDLFAMAPERTHLRYADQEARDISSFFGPKTRVLTGKSATKDAFQQSASYQFVHLATHGYLNKYAPLLSALELEPTAGNDGLLEVHEILELNMNARLVTLSACETALGSGYFSQIPAGDDFVSFTRAFLTAGSQAVLATLWEVNDKSTLRLMVDFYRRMRGNDKADALAAAQQSMREAGGRYKHPYFWAPFVLVGSVN
jgi:CHAT domain-containing protein/Tfp pilus assembly protein PilF